MSEKNEVLKSYSNFVAKLWEDDSVLTALKSDPHTVLTGYGFDIPKDAEINLIIGDINLDGSPDTQVDLFDKGEESGVYEFIVPLRPEGMDIQDLPMQDEVLELVAGGTVAAAPCCCCCPCCGSSEK